MGHAKIPARMSIVPPAASGHWRTVLILAAAVLILKLTLSFQFTGPFFEPDESTYALRAYHLANGDGLSWQHPGRGLGNKGYVIFLALPWLLAGNKPDLFLSLAYAANAVLAAADVVIGFAILRRWFPERAAVAGTLAMAVYAPVFVYGFTLLSENLFVTLCLTSLWLVQQAALTSRWFWWALAGLATALCCITRVTGASLIVAMIVVVIYNIIIQRKAKALLIAVAAMAVLVAILAASGGMGEYPWKERLLALGKAPRQFLDLGMGLVLGLVYLVLAGVGVLPLATVAFLKNYGRRRKGAGWKSLDLGILFLVTTMVGLLVFQATAVGGEAGRSVIQGRYEDLIAMFIAGCGIAYVWSGEARNWRPLAVALASAALVVAAVVLMPEIRQHFLSNLGGCCVLQIETGWKLTVGLVLVLVSLAYAALRRYPRLLAVSLVLVLIANTAIAYSYSNMIDRMQFGFFRDFGRGASGPLNEFFAAHQDQPRNVYVDILPLDIPNPIGADVIREYSICSLEFWNPGVNAVFLNALASGSNLRGVKQDVLLFSLFNPDKLGFPVIYSKKITNKSYSNLCLRIYQTTPPEPPPPSTSGGTASPPPPPFLARPAEP